MLMVNFGKFLSMRTFSGNALGADYFFFFNKRVPVAAGIALALPAIVACTAIGAAEYYFSFRHIQYLVVSKEEIVGTAGK